MSAIAPAGGSAAPAGAPPRPGSRAREEEPFEASLWLALAQRTPDLLLQPETRAATGGAGRESASEPGKHSEVRNREAPPENTRPETTPRETSAPPAPGKADAAEESPASAPAMRRGDRAAGGAPGAEKPATEAKAPAAVSAAVAAAEAESAPAPSAVRADAPVIGGLRAITLRAAGSLASAPASSAGPGAPAPSTLATAPGSVPGASGARTSTVVVPFQEANGQEGRIRLALRGDSLQATILSSNRETVQRLGSQLTDLQRALSERGFAEARLTVRQSGTEGNATSSTPSGRDPRAEDDRSGPGGRQADRDAGQQSARGRQGRGGRYS